MQLGKLKHLMLLDMLLAGIGRPSNQRVAFIFLSTGWLYPRKTVEISFYSSVKMVSTMHFNGY